MGHGSVCRDAGAGGVDVPRLLFLRHPVAADEVSDAELLCQAPGDFRLLFDRSQYRWEPPGKSQLPALFPGTPVAVDNSARKIATARLGSRCVSARTAGELSGLVADCVALLWHSADGLFGTAALCGIVSLVDVSLRVPRRDFLGETCRWGRNSGSTLVMWITASLDSNEFSDEGISHVEVIGFSRVDRAGDRWVGSVQQRDPDHEIVVLLCLWLLFPLRGWLHGLCCRLRLLHHGSMCVR